MFLLRAFYSLKDTYTPMIVNLVLTVIVQIGLYWILTTGVGPWHGIGINGIPIADSAFYLCISVVLAVLLRRRIGGYDARGIASTFARMTLASAAGAAAAWSAAFLLATVTGGFLGAVVQVAVGGVLGLGVALGLGRLLGVAEVSTATAALTRFVRRGRG